MALCAGDSVEPLVPSGWLRASKAAFVCQEVPFFMSSPTGYDGETQEDIHATWVTYQNVPLRC